MVSPLFVIIAIDGNNSGSSYDFRLPERYCSGGATGRCACREGETRKEWYWSVPLTKREFVPPSEFVSGRKVIKRKCGLCVRFVQLPPTVVYRGAA